MRDTISIGTKIVMTRFEGKRIPRRKQCIRRVTGMTRYMIEVDRKYHIWRLDAVDGDRKMDDYYVYESE